MTRKDFEETLNRILLEHLEESLTPAELTRLQKDIVANVEIDWDPFEDPDPLDVGNEDGTGSPEEFSYSRDDGDAFDDDAD
jgi:hypothetical protein